MSEASSLHPAGFRARNDLLHELRGLAALVVLVFHAQNLYQAPLIVGSASRHIMRGSYTYLGGFFEAGSSAVDFFFALSGFLMVSIHREEEGRPESRAAFYWKRFLRIFPPFWLVVAGLFVLYSLSPRMDGGARDLSTRKLVESLLLLPQGGTLIVPPAWTLSHEVFFYLVFGAAYFARKRAFGVLGAFWFAAILATSLIPPVRAAVMASRWLPIAFSARDVGFLAGCLAGHLAPRLSTRTRAVGFWAGAAGFAATWLISLRLGGRDSAEALAYPYAAASSLIILGTNAVRLGTRRWLLALGDASYSIYITHMAALAILIRLGLRLRFEEVAPAFVVATVYILGALGMGLAYHHLIERPLMSASRRVIAQVGARASTPRRPVLGSASC